MTYPSIRLSILLLILSIRIMDQDKKFELSKSTKDLLHQERQYASGGFEPMPVFFVRAKGTKLWVSAVIWFSCTVIDQLT